MITAPDAAPDGPSWWRLLLRDPVLLTACALLAVLAAAAAVLTATDRTAAGRTAAHRASAERAAGGAEAVPQTSVPSPLPGGAFPGAGRTGPGAAASAGETQEPCPVSGVVVRAGGLDAAMGLRTMELDLVNCGRRPYTVQGYPTIRTLGPGGTPLSVGIVQGPSTITVLPPVDDAPRRVTLQRGDRATAVLVWRATAVAGPADRVAYFEVTARAGALRQTISPVREPDIGTGGRMGVGPWLRTPAA